MEDFRLTDSPSDSSTDAGAGLNSPAGSGSRPYLDILKREFNKRVSKNARYSLRSYAKTLGIHPSALSRVFALKADLTPGTGVDIAKKLRLTADESRKFVRSILISRDAKEKQRLAEMLETPNLRPTPKKLSLEDYTEVAKLSYLSLLALTKTSGFRNDPVSIAQQLGLKTETVQDMLNRALELDLITISPENQMVGREEHMTAIDHADTSEVRRALQAEILDASKKSLLNDSFKKRFHYGMTMTIDSSKLELARERICEFMEDLADELECDNRDSVHQLAVSLFPVVGNI